MNINVLLQQFVDKLPPTAQLRVVGLTQIPLLLIVNPKVVVLQPDRSEMLVPLNYLTKNHLGSMYFGALSIGADSVIGLLALHVAKEFPDWRMSFVFKNFSVEFHKRAMKDVLFSCMEGAQIRRMIQAAIESGERVTEPVIGKAFEVNELDDPVASFSLGLSIKMSKK